MKKYKSQKLHFRLNWYEIIVLVVCKQAVKKSDYSQTEAMKLAKKINVNNTSLQTDECINLKR